MRCCTSTAAKHLHFAIAEVIDILKEAFIHIISEERGKNDSEVNALKAAYEKKRTR